MLDRSVECNLIRTTFRLMADAAMSPPGEGEVKIEIEQADSRIALTPPASENTEKKDDESGSDLSDLEPEEPLEEHYVQPKVEDEEDIVPDHYYEGGKVPVFKPVSTLPSPENTISHTVGLQLLTLSY